MTAVGWLPAPAEDLFGPDATAEESYDLLTVDVPPASWLTALETARDGLGCTYFDWLSAVDEPGTGFRVAAHLAALAPVRRLLVRTTVPHASPTLPSAVGVFAGAAWHERETHEMFGVDFQGHPGLDHLLLPESFEGHPLRKDFVLAARVAKAWPGAKEPGESDHGGPKRRQMLPPGVPDPNEWGPLKGQLPPAPARPARAAGARATGPRAAAGDRPVRRARSVSEGSASQQAVEESAPQLPDTGATSAGPRRSRSASEGSASQLPDTGATPAGPRRSRSASAGSASQRTTPDAPVTPPSQPPAEAAPRSPDAPWHHARPAFDEPGAETEAAPRNPQTPGTPETPEPPGTPETPEPSESPEPPESSVTPESSETPEDPAGGSQ
ncbi:NADH-quinone oxidoreductase subunit C [Streptomyces sp. NPDC090106]|uniref:NADH-quinone oxidoreductase subunit C n=1 Tax=Streptomyces sp. NPDC090106 TaxID=3365946 RepID=UPI00380F3F47